jgi:hypothetical protein
LHVGATIGADRVGLWLDKRRQYKKLLFACIMGAILSAAGGANADMDDIGDYGEVCQASSCSSYTSTNFVNENEVSGCDGFFNETLVPKFKVGGYCSPIIGKGNYSNSPEVQDCANCRSATSGTGKYCYCKIHSINGVAVASSRFVFLSDVSMESICNASCAVSCATAAKSYSDFRSVLFSAIGS